MGIGTHGGVYVQPMRIGTHGGVRVQPMRIGTHVRVCVPMRIGTHGFGLCTTHGNLLFLVKVLLFR